MFKSSSHLLVEPGASAGVRTQHSKRAYSSKLTRSKTRFSAQSCVERKLPDHPCPRRTSRFLSRSVSALLQHGLLFAPRLLLAAQMNERQRQASVTMRTRLVASECHLRDRFLVSHRGAAQVLDASPFRLTSEPSPHGHANHLAHDSAMVSALLDRSLASHTPCALPGPKKSVVFEVGR